jgi:hypothetical protein
VASEGAAPEAFATRIRPAPFASLSRFLIHTAKSTGAPARREEDAGAGNGRMRRRQRVNRATRRFRRGASDGSTDGSRRGSETHRSCHSSAPRTPPPAGAAAGGRSRPRTSWAPSCAVLCARRHFKRHIGVDDEERNHETARFLMADILEIFASTRTSSRSPPASARPPPAPLV